MGESLSVLMSRRDGLRTVVLLAPPGRRPSMETAGRRSVGSPAVTASGVTGVLCCELLQCPCGCRRRSTLQSDTVVMSPPALARSLTTESSVHPAQFSTGAGSGSRQSESSTGGVLYRVGSVMPFMVGRPGRWPRPIFANILAREAVIPRHPRGAADSLGAVAEAHCGLRGGD